ncbi:alkaline phosphatase D family protein [Oryzihumus sp.]
MSRLLLGPLLRHVGEEDATVWVETDAPCTVEVLGHAERTWTVAGHHYAVVTVRGLAPGSVTDYQVSLDGEVAWPPADTAYPPSRIRTLSPGREVTLAFGSCRYATPDAVGDDSHFAPDALDAYARRMMRLPVESWPDALLLVGDQVYADETSEATQQRIRERRDPDQAPGLEVRDFEEYTWLYHESWSDPQVRWLLSTIPSSMIFDDHDVRDDWNTSGSWRREMQATDWWQERIIGGLSSYWVYQHLGNLSPQGLEQETLYQKVRAHEGDAEELLREFATAADKEADGHKGAQWSFRRDLGPVRLVVLDSRCGRVLDGEARSMLSEREFAWVAEQVQGDYDHLLVGTSLPWLLPRALHDVESWDERLASGVQGRRLARWGEKARRGADLEHWAAFRKSFDWLTDLFARVGRGETSPSGRAPATICVLSGDVHHAYAAQADFPRDLDSAVYQLTCSPLHNYVPWFMKVVFRVTWWRATEKSVRFLLKRVSHVPAVPIEWRRLCGPFFGDQIATLTLHGRSAGVRFEQTRHDPKAGRVLGAVSELTLS